MFKEGDFVNHRYYPGTYGVGRIIKELSNGEYEVEWQDEQDNRFIEDIKEDDIEWANKNRGRMIWKQS